MLFFLNIQFNFNCLHKNCNFRFIHFYFLRFHSIKFFSLRFFFPQFYFLQKKFGILDLILRFLSYSHRLVNFKISCYFIHYLSFPNWLVILMLNLLLLNHLLPNFCLLLIIQLNLVIIRFIKVENFCQKELLFIFSG